MKQQNYEDWKKRNKAALRAEFTTLWPREFEAFMEAEWKKLNQ